MALSQAFLSAMVEQIRPLVCDNYLKKIIRFAPGSFSFSLSKSKSLKLVIALDNATPYFSLTNRDLLGSGQTSNFYQVLKKELSNAFIRDLRIDDNDRIIFFDLDVVTPAYEQRHYHLVLELIPMMANIFLIDENKTIIALYKPSKSLDVARPLAIHMTYTPPQRLQKTSPFSREERAIISQNQLDEKELLNKKNLYINEEQFYSAFPFFADQRSQLISPEEFFDLQFQQIQTKRENELFKDVFSLTNKKIKQLSHKIKRLNTELINAEKQSKLIDIANLILTYQDDIPAHASSIILADQVIALDPLKSVFMNAQAYFKKAKKAKTALVAVDQQIKEAEMELVYFLQIQHSSKMATEDELKEIKTELALNGYLPKLNHHVKKPNAVYPYVVEIDGYRIAFGHNNLQNDYLTFTLAHPKDYFLHTYQSAGAHVIIFSDNPPANIIEIAAQIALLSSGLPSGEVQITDRKHVKKGDRPGRVFVLNYQTMNIRNISAETEKIWQNATRWVAKH
ncbi:MAG: NFACT family protein [Bacilli bacterium]